MTPVPGWRGRVRALRSTRVVVAASALAAAAVALIVIGATVGSGSPAPHSLGRAKNFTLGVLGHPARQLSLQSMAGQPVIVKRVYGAVTEAELASGARLMTGRS